MPNSGFKLLISIVAYNASQTIEGVLDQIPTELWEQKYYLCDIIIFDDASKDDTCRVCEAYHSRTGKIFTLISSPHNLGYGGNQKKAYNYAIEHGYDAVVLLHGDGQYSPSLIPSLVKPVMDNAADVVIGSRMINKKSALKGGMPLYKFIGNIVLTRLQNWILDVSLSEFHSGYRVYNLKSLERVPFNENSDYFDFDTDILIQLIQTHQRIHEISIPTFYGDEISYVNGIKYAYLILLSSLVARMQKYGLIYSGKFDYQHNKIQ